MMMSFGNPFSGSDEYKQHVQQAQMKLLAEQEAQQQMELRQQMLVMPTRGKFGGAFGLPSVTRDDPAYGDNVYWRGRIWGPLNFWTYQALRRAGLDGEAAPGSKVS